MDFIWILFAFVCGYLMRLVEMPPLIGYLFAGFFLHFIGIEPVSSLDTLADLGITLMLFTIGLKLNVKDLLKTEVWASTLSHMGIWILITGSLFLLLATLAVPYFTDLDLKSAALIAFALSFSSTVCIVKLLEESGEMKTRHGQLAIGVLVMQDIVAVLFLVAATGKIPSIWAIGLLGIFLIKPLLNHMLMRAGHGELLPLAGFFLALGGYELFNLVGVKGDLGALVFGMLLSTHPKASELTKSLLSFKDLFLIGFFLSIGFTALPDWSMLGMATILAILIPLKYLMFFGIFTRLHLRGRTSYLSALALSNFSEFGLIVAYLCVDSGWLSEQWLVILALSVSISFILTSIIYRSAHSFYLRHKEKIKSYESLKPLASDIFIQPKDSEILVIGLGRVGKGAFKALHSMVGDKVWGMDADRNRIKKFQSKGLHVFYGDGEDADLWSNMDTHNIKLILLALPAIDDMLNIAEQLHSANYQGEIAAIARFPDEHDLLVEGGIDKVFNFYTEAGFGFAEESLQLIDYKKEASS
ncbi:cation:proton antiporter family protein [Neptuniibacter caesariensis]|uniref:Putative glutathione-regulated potassium-efflux system protein n=1 Tax=Neptuniibacter caesariensis TaxID=207954 RepID=A0A7U8C214_NEPCE|nr:cation:proton antiporter family protein [Neptuniibacter caesariensis]EAR60048.1 putative glutathione-regulated potassium-efflux system protein [Neptuniibacter caesariensis]